MWVTVNDYRRQFRKGKRPTKRRVIDGIKAGEIRGSYRLGEWWVHSDELDSEGSHWDDPDALMKEIEAWQPAAATR